MARRARRAGTAMATDARQPSAAPSAASRGCRASARWLVRAARRGRGASACRHDDDVRAPARREAADHLHALARPTAAAAVSSSSRASRGADQRARRRRDHRPHRRATGVSHGPRLDVARRGARAARGSRVSSSEGHDLAITPDGPRGPAKSIAPGAPIVAQRTGAPIIARGGITSSRVATQELGRGS